MKFEMDINAVTIRGGASVNTKSLGSWTAGLDNPLNIQNDVDIKNLTADVVYRVYTVVVSRNIACMTKQPSRPDHSFYYSKLRS